MHNIDVYVLSKERTLSAYKSRDRYQNRPHYHYNWHVKNSVITNRRNAQYYIYIYIFKACHLKYVAGIRSVKRTITCLFCHQKQVPRQIPTTKSVTPQ